MNGRCLSEAVSLKGIAKAGYGAIWAIIMPFRIYKQIYGQTKDLNQALTSFRQ